MSSSISLRGIPSKCTLADIQKSLTAFGQVSETDFVPFQFDSADNACTVRFASVYNAQSAVRKQTIDLFGSSVKISSTPDHPKGSLTSNAEKAAAAIKKQQEHQQQKNKMLVPSTSVNSKETNGNNNSNKTQQQQGQNNKTVTTSKQQQQQQSKQEADSCDGRVVDITIRSAIHPISSQVLTQAFRNVGELDDVHCDSPQTAGGEPIVTATVLFHETSAAARALSTLQGRAIYPNACFLDLRPGQVTPAERRAENKNKNISSAASDNINTSSLNVTAASDNNSLQGSRTMLAPTTSTTGATSSAATTMSVSATTATSSSVAAGVRGAGGKTANTNKSNKNQTETSSAAYQSSSAAYTSSSSSATTDNTNIAGASLIAKASNFALNPAAGAFVPGGGNNNNTNNNKKTSSSSSASATDVVDAATLQNFENTYGYDMNFFGNVSGNAGGGGGYQQQKAAAQALFVQAAQAAQAAQAQANINAAHVASRGSSGVAGGGIVVGGGAAHLYDPATLAALSPYLYAMEPGAPVLLIQNVPTHIPLMKLYLLLEVYGVVVGLRRQTKNPETVVAKFEQVADAMLAARLLASTPFFGKELQLRHFAGYEDRGGFAPGPAIPNDPENPACTTFDFTTTRHRGRPHGHGGVTGKKYPPAPHLFVANLTEDISEEDVAEVFRQKGYEPVDMARKNLCFMIISFEDTSTGVEALIDVHSTVLKDRYLRVTFSGFPAHTNLSSFDGTDESNAMMMMSGGDNVNAASATASAATKSKKKSSAAKKKKKKAQQQEVSAASDVVEASDNNNNDNNDISQQEEITVNS